MCHQKLEQILWNYIKITIVSIKNNGRKKIWFENTYDHQKNVKNSFGSLDVH